MMVTQLGQCVWCRQMIAMAACVRARVCGQLVNPNYGMPGRPLQEPLSELPEQTQEVAHARPTLHLVISPRSSPASR